MAKYLPAHADLGGRGARRLGANRERRRHEVFPDCADRSWKSAACPKQGLSYPERHLLARSLCKDLSYWVLAGVARMRKVWSVAIAHALGLELCACSKCEIHDLLPKMCKSGTGTGRTQLRALDTV